MSEIVWERMPLSRLRDGVEPAQSSPEPHRLNADAESAAQALAFPRFPGGALGALVAALDAAALSGPALAVTGRWEVAALAASAGLCVLGALGGWRLRRLAAPLRSGAPRLAIASVAAALVSVAGGAAGPEAAAASALGVATAVTLRLGAAALAGWALSARAEARHAVVVGGGGNADRLIQGLAENPDNDIRIVGIFDDRGDDRSPPMVAGVRKLGTIDELLAFARAARVDMLIVTLPLSAERRILAILRRLWVLPIDVRLSAYSSDYAFRGTGAALIGVADRPLAEWRRHAKRALDVVGAGLALIALSPVMLATALAIRLESPGPALFRQLRHGYNNRPVEVLKFRSMRSECCDPEGRRIVTKGDPRVTRVGRLIRRTSIDELPQLLNVLSGELSLVGPRPHALTARSSREQLFTEIVDGYSGRHRVPPGITGWAQIHGWRGEVDGPEALTRRFEHDLWYIENWSVWLDLSILLRTPLSLFGARGAY